MLKSYLTNLRKDFKMIITNSDGTYRRLIGRDLVMLNKSRLPNEFHGVTFSKPTQEELAWYDRLVQEAENTGGLRDIHGNEIPQSVLDENSRTRHLMPAQAKGLVGFFGGSNDVIDLLTEAGECFSGVKLTNGHTIDGVRVDGYIAYLDRGITAVISTPEGHLCEIPTTSIDSVLIDPKKVN